MRENRQIVVDYEDFFGNSIKGIKVNPYFIRLFKRRWYVMALVLPGKEIHRFGLDRIKRIEVLESKFTYPKDFSPQEYYTDYYGVFHDEEPKTVRLKAYGVKANYLRSLPLHHSQHEIESNGEYAIFEYLIAPSFDFVQEVLSHGNQLEVLSPTSFRQQIKNIIQEMHAFYE